MLDANDKTLEPGQFIVYALRGTGGSLYFGSIKEIRDSTSKIQVINCSADGKVTYKKRWDDNIGNFVNTDKEQVTWLNYTHKTRFLVLDS